MHFALVGRSNVRLCIEITPREEAKIVMHLEFSLVSTYSKCNAKSFNYLV